MRLSLEEVLLIERIFRQIEPNVLPSIQQYRPEEEFRINTIFALGLKYDRTCDCVYMNFTNLTPWQKKIFEKRSKKELPGRGYIEQVETILRLGFK